MKVDPDVARDATPRPQHLPVLALGDPQLLDVVLAALRRAGGDPDVLTIEEADGSALRSALARGPEAIVALCDATATIAAVHEIRIAGARPLPVLLFARGEPRPIVSHESLALLCHPTVADLEVAVPSLDDDETRRALWDQLRRVGVEDRHHLVEVDGRSAVEGLADRGSPEFADLWVALGAGAAGVLAGRMVVSNRRWRAHLGA